MDLLTSGRCSRVVALGLLMGALGCAPDDAPTGSGPPSSSASPSASPTVAVPAIEQVRPDEEVLGRRIGTGATPAAVTGTTQDLVYVYGVCSGGGEITAHLVSRARSEVVMPCDGVVSRMQVYSEPGQEFRVAVAAGADQRWRLLVTTRDETGTGAD